MDQEAIEVVAREVYGSSLVLKPEQLQILKYLLAGKDVFTMLPTAYGKSLVYVLLPLVHKCISNEDKICLVISPLVALLDDQAKSLREKGLNVWVLGRPEPPKYTHILASPERCLKRAGRQVLLDRATNIGWVVFDEAHCICHWGSTFRPAYRRIEEIMSIIICPVLAMSATLTADMQQDICRVLNMATAAVVGLLPDRENVHLHIEAKARSTADLMWVVRATSQLKGKMPKTLIFTRTVDSATALFFDFVEMFESCSVDIMEERSVEMYHAATPQSAKDRVLSVFPKADSPIRILIATIAFGLGINIPDIAVVVNWGLPSSVLEYWQQVGRCARSELVGVNVVYPVGKLDASVSRLMKKLFGGETCIRSEVLRHFHLPGMDVTAAELPENQRNCKLCKCCSVCKRLCKNPEPDILSEILQLDASEARSSVNNNYPDEACEDSPSDAGASPFVSESSPDFSSTTNASGSTSSEEEYLPEDPLE